MSLSPTLRRGLIDSDHEDLSLRRQCELLSISRSLLYYEPRGESELNLKLMRLMDEHYLDHAYKGARRMHVWLTRDLGYAVSRNRIEAAVLPHYGSTVTATGPHTSKRCRVTLRCTPTCCGSLQLNGAIKSGYRHHLCPHEAGLSVFDGHHRSVQSVRSALEGLQFHGSQLVSGSGARSH